ncbi:hypothetical protein D3C85_1429180 [compost metagenome]
MNTQHTLATVEATMRDKITAQCGGKLIVVSEGALMQMDAVTKLIIEGTNFELDKLTNQELATANMFAAMFTKDHISGDVVDGVLVAGDADAIEVAMEQVKGAIDNFSPGTVLPIYLINKIVQEVKQFTR